MTVAAYFLRDERVAAAHVRVTKTQAVATAAMQAVLAGPPPGYDLTTAIPAGTRLNGVRIDGGIASVDLSNRYASGGDSGSMRTRLAQVVYTLTQFPTVRGVTFELDGKPVTALGGEGVVLDRPQTRADYEDETPPILVESPAPGDTVTSPVRVAGTANVFEATFSVRIVKNGEKLVEKVVTATSGSGERGTFETAIPVAATGPATLVALEYSAEDGSEIHKVAFPVTLATTP